MSRSRSRYDGCRPFVALPGDPRPFRGLLPRDLSLPAGVLEHAVRAGERLDLLARDYYDDPRLWWRIVDANPGALAVDDLVGPSREGETLLVPASED